MTLQGTLARNNAPLDNPTRLADHISRALAAKPQGGWELALAYRVIRTWFRPRIFAAGNIPEQPCLFVGNHGLFAIDGLILTLLMLHDYNRFLRPMGDKFLFRQPQIAEYLLRRGATMGHPQVCSALMKTGQDLLVFPGGAHEAVKHARDNYRLLWKERLGFVRLAAQHGYTIVPFGMVGPDDFYHHLLEGEDIADSLLGVLLRRAGILHVNTRRDLIPPLARGTLGTALPRPVPCLIGFGKAIDLTALRGQRLTKGRLAELRSQVAQEIQRQLDTLLGLRDEASADQSLLRRFLSL